MRWLVVLLLAGFASAAHAQSALAPMAWFSGPSGRATVPLQRSTDQKLYLTVLVNGEPLTLFIDTGATTILHVDVIRRLGLPLADTEDQAIGLTGVAGRRQTAEVNMVVGKTTITGYQVSVLDMTATRELHAQHNLPVIDGLIGADLLAVMRARIDFDRLVLEVRRPDQATIERIGLARAASE